ncbi:ankyrin repeat protein [Tritrichomonas foetus]|uniref:Ankyrin repeat protein n=1 Tax=Tritrichomonas foetus TaxID=1144522 RepID=A0A1J4K4K9_9EUKA|nr:ankyrin repeat protein [Tritrichomonas foetus]|eukprot:OHT05784.1 ankyrin repeat protein [Tritrichomonas foetus]
MWVVTSRLRTPYNFTGIDFYLSMIFIWFAPEIEQYNKTFYNDIENKFKLLWEFEYNSLVIYNVCNNFSHYKENNWKLLKLHRNLNFHQSPASEYIANDDVNSLQILLSNTKLDINSRIQLSSYEWRAYLQKGPTLIQVSAFYGSLNCFKYLLLNGADLSMYDYEGKNVAHFAVAGGNNEIIRILLQKEIPFEGTLQVATKFHRNDIFRWIYDNNYVTLTEIHEVTGYVLQQATMSNNFYIMRFCIDNKINVNMSNIDGVLFYLSNWTPLHFAAQYNNVKTAQLLITQENIDLNCKTNLDFSPLHLTAINGSLEMCKLLLDQDNTDVNAIDNNNLTALHYAATYGHNNIIELFLSNDKVDVNAKDTYGNTPLHLAARYGHKEAVILLLQNEKTDPNATNEIFMNFL